MLYRAKVGAQYMSTFSYPDLFSSPSFRKRLLEFVGMGTVEVGAGVLRREVFIHCSSGSNSSVTIMQELWYL